jgi:phospholipase A1
MTAFLLRKGLFPVMRILANLPQGALAALLISFAACSAQAQSTSTAETLMCGALESDAERLVCYDRATRRARGADLPPAGTPAGVSPGSSTPPLLDPSTAQTAREARRARGSTMTDRWELDAASKEGTFLLRPYKPMYVLPIRWMSSPNQTPTSEGAGNSVSEPQNIRAIEAEFQISLKSKIWESAFGSNVDLWVGYTQSSQWQVYTPGISRPFRETNYEPEIFAVWGTNWEVFGWHARMLSIGFNHQSNGRAEPLSRSWNRVIGQVGLDRGDWMVLIRPWWRIQEQAVNDDNPGIENYIGRGEVVIVRKIGAHQVAVQLRHSLKGGANNHGSAQVDWSFPISGYLKGHVQMFTGYGDTLIDYNHRQTTIGVGVSLTNWL